MFRVLRHLDDVLYPLGVVHDKRHFKKADVLVVSARNMRKKA